MSIIKRNNVRVSGTGRRAIVFAHGFGCDQAMWGLAAPAFEQDYRVALSGHVGSGHADHACYDPVPHDRLDTYAQDVLAICGALQLEQPVFAGDSLSAICVHLTIPGRTLLHMQAAGHCPNLSAPEKAIAAIRSFLETP